MFEPEDFLETLDRMIELNLGILGEVTDDDLSDEIQLDLKRLRDLQHRIKIQFGIENEVIH